MPEKPYIFNSVDDAIEKLIAYDFRFLFPFNDFEKPDIIAKSVRSNIFRALSINENKPSLIYRDWANRSFESLFYELETVTTSTQYDDILYFYSQQFIEYWAENVGNKSDRIGYGPAIKMVNLLIKTMQESSAYQQNKLYKFMHIPFDYFTLLPLKNIINEISNESFKITIPNNPSMAYITNKELYVIFTNSLFYLCKKAKIKPIIYDYWAWNNTHN